jgi:hypothetical protein
MIALNFVFFMFVFLGAVVGAMRGYAKELLVAFSAFLAISIILLLESYVGVYQVFVSQSIVTRFWARAMIILVVAFFGYQTPKIKRLQDAARREKITDSFLGIVIGGVNAYLIIGSIWAYLAQAGYDNFNGITGPLAGTALGDTAIRWVSYMPPQYLDIPMIFYIVIAAFTFVVIVYV